MDVQEIGWGARPGLMWLAQDRNRWRTFVNVVVNFRFTYNAGNFLASGKPVRFSRTTLLVSK